MSKPNLGRRIAKYLFFGVLNLIILIVVLIAAVPLLVDENDIKTQIVQIVHNRTGRTIGLDGDLKLSVFPWLGVELNDIRLSNAPGFGTEPFARLQHAQVRIELLPLTRRELRMDTITLEGLDLRLQRNADGTSNWDDLLAAGSKSQPPTQGSGKDQAPASEAGGKSEMLAVFALGGVNIKNARIEFEDPQQNLQLSNLLLRTGPVSLTDPVDITLESHFQHSTAQHDNDLKGRLQGSTRIAFDLAAKRYRLEKLSSQLSISYPALWASPALIKAAGAVGFDQVAGVINTQALQLDLESTLTTKSPSGAVKLNLAVDTDLELRLKQQTLAVTRLHLKIPGLEHAGRRLSLDANTLLAGNLKTGQFLFDSFSANGNFTDPALSKQALAFRLNSDLRLDLNKQQLAAENFRLAADKVNVGGSMQAHWGQAKPSASGTLAVPQVALRSVLERFGVALPKTRSSKAFSSASLSSRFYADADQVTLEQLKARLDAGTVTGKVRVSHFSQPKISYRLKIDKLDADAYLAPKQKGAPPVAIAALPVKTLRALDVDGRLDVGQLRYSGLRMNNVQIGIKAAKGLLQFKPLQANLAQGIYQGRISIDARKSPRLILDERLSKVDLHSLLRTFGIPTGALNLRGGRSSLRLQGQFSTDASGRRLRGKNVALDGKIAGRSFKGGPVKVALHGNMDLDLGAKTLEIKELNSAFAEFKVSGSLKASGLDTQPQYDASIKVARFNPRKLARRLGVRIPRTADSKVLRALSLDTRIKGTQTGIQSAPLTVKLDDTTLQGNLTIAGLKNPAIVFDLGVDNLNLDRYLPPQAKHKAATPGAAATVLPLYLVRDLNLNGKLKVKKFKVSGLSMRNVRITATAKDGKLKLSPLRANLYKGSYQGNVNLDVSSQQPKLNVNETIKGVQIGTLLRDLNGKSPPLTGAANVHAVLTTISANTQTMKQNLNGTLNFSIQNGTLEKVDLVNSMCTALSAIDLGNLNKRSLATGLLGLIAATRAKPTTGNANASGSTRFTDLRGNSTITNGVARNKDLLMTSPVVRVTGDGSIDLAASRINYLAKAELVQSCAGIGKRDLSGQQIPVQISGPLDNPNISPQLTAGLVNALRGKARQNTTAQQPASPTQQLQQQLNPAQTNQPVKRGTALKNTRDKVIKGLLKGLFQ